MTLDVMSLRILSSATMCGLRFISRRSVGLQCRRNISLIPALRCHCTSPELLHESDATRMNQLDTKLSQERLAQKKRSIVTSGSVYLSKLNDELFKPKVKISVIGAGQVGLASINSIIQRGIVTDLAFVDIDEKRVRGEQLDFHQSGAFLARPIEVTASTDYSCTKGSKIVVISAGARQKPGEPRTSLTGRNVEIFKKVVPEVIKESPRCIILVDTNPVDEMTYVAYKLSGFRSNRVFGSGTNLDSGRLRGFVAEKIGERQALVDGWIIGEHGELSTPVWSSVHVRGTPLLDAFPEFTQYFEDIQRRVIRSAYDIIELKGYTSWGIGSSVADICSTIINNTMMTHCLSTVVKGQFGITTETFVSLPCKVGPDGFKTFDPIRLDKHEKDGFFKAVKKIQADQDAIGL